MPTLTLESTVYTLQQLLDVPEAQVALAGRSNVGKSSLINALAVRKKLAKVSATPGKTRSINFYRVQPHNFFLVDLPGYGYARASHSERRSYHGETDLQVNAKTKILLDDSITPIICVGESLAQREHDLTETYVAYQVAAAFSGLTAEQAMHCVIAYEPLWAIGTGNTATSAQAQEVCASIRATLGKLYDLETAKTISILYGGSMNAGNAAELLAQPDIDGGLIGGASLKPVDFSKIVAATAQGACE